MLSGTLDFFFLNELNVFVSFAALIHARYEYCIALRYPAWQGKRTDRTFVSSLLLLTSKMSDLLNRHISWLGEVPPAPCPRSLENC